MIPGANLLKTALSVIGRTTVKYYKYASRTTNQAGFDVTTYTYKGEYSNGSLQPVKRSKYSFMGLDFQKKYYNWFIPSLDIVDIDRGTSGDVIEALGMRMQLQSMQDWYGIDGWKSVVCIVIGPATGALTNA